MLKTIKSGAARFTWRGRVLLLCVAAGALALPAVQLMRPTQAVADEGQPGDENSALDPFGKQRERETAKDKPEASDPFGEDPKRETTKDEKASNPFGQEPKLETPKDKLPAGAQAPGDPFGAQPEQNPQADKKAAADEKPEINLKSTPEAAKPRAVQVEYLPQPSPNEAKILAQLEVKTVCEFSEAPLVEVVKYFEDRHDIPIRVDQKALTEEAVDTSVPVTAQFSGITLKSMLRNILSDLNLTYIVNDEVLTITTKTVADKMLSTRVYPVGDLVGGGEKAADFEGLLQAIMTTVDPKTWHEEGGPGTAKVVPNAKSIVVSQTDATHDKVLDLLRSLRAAKAKQESQDATTLDIRPDIELKIER